MPKSSHQFFSRRDLIWAAIGLIAFYVLLPQFKSFSHSLHLLTHPNLAWVALAIGFSLTTYLLAAATYCLLAIKALTYTGEVLVQLATMFVNRLLPGGLGGIGANFEYLRHKGHSRYLAGGIVAVNNLMGAFGHALIVGLTLIFFASPKLWPGFRLHYSKTVAIIVVALIISAVIFLLIFSLKRVHGFLSSLYKQIVDYKHRPGRSSLALITQMALTLANVAALWASAQAVGIHLALVDFIIIFTIGAGARNITPTPGGLGGFEAGLVAALVAYQVPSAQALASVLLFRLITFWLPIIVGAGVFIELERKGWFTAARG